jgi:hypothetical protein
VDDYTEEMMKTPRTDAAALKVSVNIGSFEWDAVDQYVVRADFARQLERELNIWKAQRAEVVPQDKVLVDRQLILDIQSNAACGEPEWNGIEDRLLKLVMRPL